MSQAIWQKCLACLQDELPSHQFNTWIRPLKVNEEGRMIQLLAPNRFVQDWVRDKYFSRIRELVADYATDDTQGVELVVAVGSSSSSAANYKAERASVIATPGFVPNAPAYPSFATRQSGAIIQPQFNTEAVPERVIQVEGSVRHQSYLNRAFTFSSFVQGKSNQLA
ncbi:chromosomal replication initiator protein DnaA, partial [Oceanospirillaceae bacterium]|nr:chromosomal replication initiator protein DnaA [Oceanospirillaceae bacterium]